MYMVYGESQTEILTKKLGQTRRAKIAVSP